MVANTLAYFHIDDPVLRTLVASKCYSAKVTEYAIIVANAFFTSVTRASVDDAIAATNDGDVKTTAILLAQVANKMAALETPTPQPPRTTSPTTCCATSSRWASKARGAPPSQT